MDLGFDLSKVEGFEWDKGNLEHIKKHNVKEKECEEIFLNLPLIILFDEKHSKTEKRYGVFGASSTGRKLALSITIRNDKIRVIMGRDQSRKERKTFNREKEKLGDEKYAKT